MDDNQNSGTIKILVDALYGYLKEISDKINSYHPVLNQIDENIDKEIAEINKILFDTQTMVKLLDTSIGDFYKRTDLILNNIKDLSTKIDSISNLSQDLNGFKNDIIKDIDNIDKKIDSFRESIKPVITLSNWITKPIGIIIFIISLLLASIAVVNGFNSIINYAKQSQQSVSK